MIITSSGTPFLKNGLDIKIENECLIIEGKQVILNGEPLKAERIRGEGKVEFVKTSDGDFQIVDSTDEREGKKMFINKDTGELYRK